jgi:hypothetical protein
MDNFQLFISLLSLVHNNRNARGIERWILPKSVEAAAATRPLAKHYHALRAAEILIVSAR